jgi:hypothetical protein
VTYFAETSAFSLIALLVAGFGSNAGGRAPDCAELCTSLVFMVPLSLGVALLTRVGQALGAGDPLRGAIPGLGGGCAWRCVGGDIRHADRVHAPRTSPPPTPMMPLKSALCRATAVCLQRFSSCPMPHR